MKIGSNSDTSPVTTPVVAERTGDTAKAGKAGAAAAPPEASAEVALSQTATELATSGADPSFDAEKVDRITRAIADGTFKPNPEAIADKLISNAQEVLGKVSH